MKATNPDVDTSTVYRTLGLFEELGIVEHAHLGHGPAVYHLGQTHQHLVCEVCGTVIDVPVGALDALAARAPRGLRLPDPTRPLRPDRPLRAARRRRLTAHRPTQWSTAAGDSAELRLALVEERVDRFPWSSVSKVTHSNASAMVVEARHLVLEHLVDQPLVELDRVHGPGGEPPRHRHARLLQRVGRDDVVDEAQALGVLGREQIARS